MAEKYLRDPRGITTRLPRCLRFLPLVQPFPTLVAGIQDASGVFTGVLVTWLCADGTGKAPVDPGRKIFGQLGGGSVRLAPASEKLVLCEGVETGLFIAQSCAELPVWRALSATNLSHVAIPPSVREVIIAADADTAGESAAHLAADRFLREGRSVRIARPEPGA